MIFFVTNLAFYSLIRTFDLRSKVLTLENAQINLAFYSLIRTFAHKFNLKRRKSMKIIRCLMLAVVALFLTDTLSAQVTQWRDVHKTKRKETLYSIAQDYGITVDELIKANPEMAAPDYVLKKGTFVCIPFPQMQARPDTVIAKPEPPKPSKGDMRAREIRVGVMLPLHSVNGDGRRMTEYYRGVLMACDSLRQTGISVDVHAWNVAEDTDINSFLTDEAAQMDLIIGPLYSKMVKPLSDFATKNDIRVLIPFSINTPEVEKNPLLYQVYQAPRDFHRLMADRFIKQFPNCHPVIIDCNDSTSTKGSFTKVLRQRLDEEAITYSVTNLNTSESKFVQNFSMAQRNVVVLNSENSKPLKKALSKLTGMMVDNQELEVSLFGYTEWMLHTSRNIENFYKLDVHVPGAFYYDANSPKTKRIELKYRWNFHADMIHSLPRFAITGFDHAYYFIRGLHLYGKHFTGAPGMVGYPAIQTPLNFERLGTGGQENKNILLIHYTPEKRIEVIK